MKINDRKPSSKVYFGLRLMILLIVLPSVLSTSVRAQDNIALRPRIESAERADLSPPLRSLKPLLAKFKKAEDDKGTGPVNDTRHDPDPLVQNSEGRGIFNQDIPPTGVSFDGLVNTSGVNPPDTVGDIGPNHYVQMVNSRFQIFTRAGVSVYGPANINTLFAGFGGPCQTENAGDPVVLYDQLADRWLLSQFTAAGPNYFNCVALSTTSDPTGTYYRYAFSTGTRFPDYPKYGVWSNAYFISTREFNGGAFAGVGAYALNRAQMLAGNLSPQVVSFLLPPGTQAFRPGDGLLPADLDGTALPPTNTHYFVGSMDSGFAAYGAPADALNLFKFNVDWVTPANSTFAFASQLNSAAFDTVYPCVTNARNCVPQPGTAVRLDVLSYRQRPLHRLAYRNFGTHESLVTTQSVEATAGVAGMRWWEVRDPNGAAAIYQEGTYAPADAVNRWMGSAAMDNDGNMGLAYSVSNAVDVFPGIRYTGRLAGDPLGTMPQGEGVIVNGAGSQTTTNYRWGDYTSINIDPVDDCTFWYTNEYYAATSASGWRTRIGSFKFPNCSVSNVVTANITGRVVNSAGRGMPGVRLFLTNRNFTEPRYAQTNSFGYYRFVDLPVNETYALSLNAKNRTFTPPTQTLTLTENVEEINFVGN